MRTLWRQSRYGTWNWRPETVERLAETLGNRAAVSERHGGWSSVVVLGFVLWRRSAARCIVARFQASTTKQLLLAPSAAGSGHLPEPWGAQIKGGPCSTHQSPVSGMRQKRGDVGGRRFRPHPSENGPKGLYAHPEWRHQPGTSVSNDTEARPPHIAARLLLFFFLLFRGLT